MTFVSVKHKVRDYKAWKSVFDNFGETRKSAGEKSFQICHEEDNPNDLNLMFEWDNDENARSFMTSSELKNTMQKAGVLEHPQIHFLKEVDSGEL